MPQRALTAMGKVERLIQDVSYASIESVCIGRRAESPSQPKVVKVMG